MTALRYQGGVMDPTILNAPSGTGRSIARAGLFAAALGIAVPSTIWAQPRRGSVDQIGTSQPVGMQQVARGAAVANTTPQVASVADSASPARQLTSERGAIPDAAQLSKGPRSAQASTALSSRADGRTAVVERVAGADRCDPAATRPARADKCAAVIENRAAEFVRREASPLSPEQRIIVDQQLRERTAGMVGAARRLAANGDDATSIDAQSVASVVLAAPPPDPRSEPPKDDPAAMAQQAIINAIVNRAGGQ